MCLFFNTEGREHGSMTEHLLSTHLCTSCHTILNTFKNHRQGLLQPILQMQKLRLREGRNLLKVTQLGSSRARI